MTVTPAGTQWGREFIYGDAKCACVMFPLIKTSGVFVGGEFPPPTREDPIEDLFYVSILRGERADCDAALEKMKLRFVGKPAGDLILLTDEDRYGK